MPWLRRTAVLGFVVSLVGCGTSTRPATDEDRKKAAARCDGPRKKAPYSDELSEAMTEDLEQRCQSGDLECGRFAKAIVRVCAYKNPVAKILLSEAVEVYTSIGSSDDLALNQLCVAMRAVKHVGFLGDIDVYVARGGDSYWGKGWRRRCAQGSGGGGEHR